MPVYNCEKYLNFSIESVLKQTYEDFEFIIINDCSTDKSEKVIKNFTDKRIVYIKNDTNLKLNKTLNIGLNIAKGKYIARVDADDVCDVVRIEKQINFLERNKDFGLVSSWFKIIDEQGVLIKNIKLNYCPEEIFLNLHFFNCIVHSSVFFRKELINITGIYDENKKYIEDYDLWLRMLKYTKFYIIKSYLIKYRMHSNNISNIFEKEQKENAMKISIENFLISKDLYMFFNGFNKYRFMRKIKLLKEFIFFTKSIFLLNRNIRFNVISSFFVTLKKVISLFFK